MYDLIIVGAGPVGLYAAFYSGMRDMKTLVIDSLDMVGGQLTSLYPEKDIYDVAGFEKIKAKNLIANLEKQASRFDHDYILGEQVVKVEKIHDYFEVTTNKATYESKFILLATGTGSFSPRKTGLSNESEFSNISYNVTDPNKFANQQVTILGGGDSAIDYALMLDQVNADVNIVHRRNQFRAHEHSLEMLEETNVRKITPYVIEKLIGENKVLNSVVIKNVDDESLLTINVDHLIVSYGFVSSLGFINDLDVVLEKQQIVVNDEYETSIKGIFAAGDGCSYPNKAKLITVGFGEAVIAVNMIKKYLDPEKYNNNLHSSAKFGDEKIGK